MSLEATSIQQDLTEIFDRLEILSPAMIWFGGESIPVTPGPVLPLPGFNAHPLPQIPLVRDLQALFYSRCYTQRLGDPAPSERAAPDPGFVAALSAANRSRNGWEGGWTIYQTTATGQVWLAKGDRQRSAGPGEYISSGVPGRPPQAGQIVQVQVPRESAVAQPGFYFLYGETLSDVWDEGTLVRFYFHAPYRTMPELTGELSARLNRFRIPFQMKALNDPSLYERTDAAVLYVARRYFAIASRIVHTLPSTLTGQLREGAPLFTRTIRPGIGIAEDPNTGESFGMNRCRLLAEGVVDAWQRGDGTPQGRWSAVEARFRANGMDLTVPWRGASAIDLEKTGEEVRFAYA